MKHHPPVLALALALTPLLTACPDHDRGTVATTGGRSATVMDINGMPVTFTAGAGIIENLALVPVPANAPAGFKYPNGLFSFTITGLSPGATVPVTISLPAGSGPTAYIKCGSACAPFAGAAIGGDTVTLTLADGGDGDADGTANGVISDPGGPGVGIAIGLLKPNALDFGQEPSFGPETDPRTVILKNVGEAPLKILGSNRSSSDVFFFVTGLGFITLAPGEKLEFSVSFDPLLAGTATTQFGIATNAGNLTLDLSGTGVPPVEVEPFASVDFGEQTVGTDSGPRFITLRNVSTDATVSLKSVRLVDGTMGFTSPGGGTLQQMDSTPLAPGESGTVAVAFNPNKEGTVQDELQIFFNVSKGGRTGELPFVVFVDLSGTGVAAAASGVGSFTSEPAGANKDKGLSAVPVPPPSGSDCLPGSTCTQAPAVQTVDAQATFNLLLGDIVLAAAQAGFLRPGRSVGNLYAAAGDVFRARLSDSTNPKAKTTKAANATSKALAISGPVQVSSENQIGDQLCSNYAVHSNYGDPLATLFFYQLPGANQSCQPSDSTFRFTPLSADANTAPRAAPSLFPGDRVEAFYDGAGKAIAFVALSLVPTANNPFRTDLVMYDANFENPKTVASDVQFFDGAVAQNAGSKIYVDTNSFFRLAADGTFSPIQAVNGSFGGGAGGSPFYDDGSRLYYLLQDSSGANSVLRLPMDGSGGAVSIGTLPVDSDIAYGLVGSTDNAVLVLGRQSSFATTNKPMTLYSVPKNPANPPVAATVLDTIPIGSTFNFVITQNDTVYYNVFDLGPNSFTAVKAVSAKDDGTSTAATANARWLYFVVDNQTPAGLYDDRAVTDLVLAQGFSDFANTGDNGATITVLHLADNSSRDLTTLNYAAGTALFLTFPDHGLSSGLGTISLGGQTDLFAFDLNASDPAQRLVQLTNTPNDNEHLIRDLRFGFFQVNTVFAPANGAKRLINFE